MESETPAGRVSVAEEAGEPRPSVAPGAVVGEGEEDVRAAAQGGCQPLAQFPALSRTRLR